MTPAKQRLETAKFDMHSPEAMDCIRLHLHSIIDYIDTGIDVRPPIIEKMFLTLLSKVGEKHREIYESDSNVISEIKLHISKCLSDNYYNSSLFTYSYY